VRGLLVAGISRSSAAALAVIASKLAGAPDIKRATRAFSELLDVKREIHPNRDMVEYIDEQLEFKGSLVKARGMVFGGGELVWVPPQLDALEPEDFE